MFEQYKQNRNDVAFMLQMEDGLRQWIRIQFERAAQEEANRVGDETIAVTNEAKRIRRVVGKYASALMMLEDVYEIDAKYRDEVFLKFWEIYCRVYRSLMNATGDDGVVRPDIETDDEVPGITISENETDENEDEEEENTGGEGGSNGSISSSPQQDILDVIHRWNQKEELSAEEVQKWLQEIEKMFSVFVADERFMAVLRDKTFTTDVKFDEYRKTLNKYRRSLHRREDIGKVFLLNKMLADNSEQFFDIFVEAWVG